MHDSPVSIQVLLIDSIDTWVKTFAHLSLGVLNLGSTRDSKPFLLMRKFNCQVRRLINYLLHYVLRRIIKFPFDFSEVEKMTQTVFKFPYK